MFEKVGAGSKPARSKNVILNKFSGSIKNNTRVQMQKTIKLKSDEEALKLCGTCDENITVCEEKFGVSVTPRGHSLILRGTEEAVGQSTAFFEQLLRAIRRGESFDIEEIRRDSEQSWDAADIKKRLSGDSVYSTFSGKPIKPRSDQQAQYVDEVSKNDIVFGIGPAGTGKTYLAVAFALRALSERNVQRIILTRPAVEAGESLGFLPGDLQAKINPYLRPLYDALYDMIGFERARDYLEKGVIEVAPLAYMRGRTLNDAFIILDEAQNTTQQQMKMFLTRMGFSSKCVITGDITQVDLPRGVNSGLISAKKILSGVKGIEFVYFTEKDVVRHKLVRDIIRAYEKEEKRREKTKKKKV